MREGARFYERRDPDLRRRFLNTLGAVFDLIAEAPLRWPVVRGLPSERPLRYYVMPDFPYTVVFQVRSEDTLQIVAVGHQKRRPRYWALRR